MGLGICTIVSDIEPLAELPLGACIKIAPDSYQAPTLAAVLKTLAAQPDFRHLISANGQRVIDASYRLDQIARDTVAFARRVIKAR